MKPMLRLLALVLVVLASLSALPSAADTQPLLPKSCAELCARILCAFPQTCGPFVDSTGTQRCGCHNRT